MYTLANLENVLCERRVNYENLPRPRHKYAPENGGHDKDNTCIEDHQVGRVASKETGQHFLLEQNEPESRPHKHIVFKFVHLGCRAGICGEVLSQLPIIVREVLS